MPRIMAIKDLPRRFDSTNLSENTCSDDGWKSTQGLATLFPVNMERAKLAPRTLTNGINRTVRPVKVEVPLRISR